jgi:transcriptional regulator with XRE-family HTH domain
MSRTLSTARHACLVSFLIEKRKKAGLTQTDVAKRLRRYQSFVASVETGQRKVDVIELLAFAKAIGFDPREAIRKLLAVEED